MGISYEQAGQYCRWLTEKYSSFKNRKFKNVEFKLPEIAQWTYAAQGGKQRLYFPWDGYEMRDKKGNWRANFWVIPQYMIGKLSLPSAPCEGYGESKEILMAYGGRSSISLSPKSGLSDMLAPVKSYSPNEYGIYNLSGNVEEYVREKGISKGGSWKDSGYYLQIMVEEKYDSLHACSAERGFRFVMELQN